MTIARKWNPNHKLESIILLTTADQKWSQIIWDKKKLTVLIEMIEFLTLTFEDFNHAVPLLDQSQALVAHRTNNTDTRLKRAPYKVVWIYTAYSNPTCFNGPIVS